MYRLLLIIIFIHSFSNAMQDRKNLLILHSYSPSYIWTKNIQKGIDSVFDSNKYNIRIEYMDTKSHNNQAHYQNILDGYKDKYTSKGIRFDAILVSDNNGLNFLKKYKEELFGNVPVIFCGINYLKKSDLDGFVDITGINEKPDILDNFRLIQKLHPNNKKIYITVGTTLTGLRIEQKVSQIIDMLPQDKIQYIILQGDSIAEIAEYLKDKEGVVLITDYFRDNYNNQYLYFELTERLSRTIKLPLYGISDINFGNGIVGGYLTSGFSQGKEAAKMAKKVLNGIEASKIPIKYNSPNKYMFDYKQIIEHSIDLKKLPEDSILINYDKTFFEKYKKEILFIVIILCILIIVNIYLSININKRKKAEELLLENEKNLENKVVERTKELNNNLIELKKMQEKLIYTEKMASLGGLVAGVAHEINTPIGINLTAATHFMDLTKRISDLYKNDNISQDEFEEYLDTSYKLASSMLSNLNKAANLIKSFKQISVDQTSEEKRTFELSEYTDEILTSLNNIIKRYKIKFEVKSPQILLNSYPGAYSQIITNLILNTLYHAFDKKENGNVKIIIKKEDNKILIDFIDNGKGISKDKINKIFDPFFTTNREHGGSGLGLNIVYNIVKSTFNGSITCKSTLGEGAKFHIVLTV